mmetsp:Transcript_23549/g.56205  ORF Transcript_23549/g.56205 Transcript_23549/m.56205 type:complete len:252 (-) Transcript_23549:1881-2636(-)
MTKRKVAKATKEDTRFKPSLVHILFPLASTRQARHRRGGPLYPTRTSLALPAPTNSSPLSKNIFYTVDMRWFRARRRVPDSGCRTAARRCQAAIWWWCFSRWSISPTQTAWRRGRRLQGAGRRCCASTTPSSSTSTRPSTSGPSPSTWAWTRCSALTCAASTPATSRAGSSTSTRSSSACCAPKPLLPAAPPPPISNLKRWCRTRAEEGSPGAEPRSSWPRGSSRTAASKSSSAPRPRSRASRQWSCGRRC